MQKDGERSGSGFRVSVRVRLSKSRKYRKMGKDQDLGLGSGLGGISFSFLVGTVVAVRVCVVKGAGDSKGRYVTFSAWTSVQLARGSAFHGLTVAKDRGPYEGN